MHLVRHIFCSGLFLLITGCASKAIMITSVPSGAQVFTHTDFMRDLLGTTPLTSSVDAMMPDWTNDDGVTSTTLIFKKPGYKDTRLKIREFEIPAEISVVLQPENP